MMPHAIAFARLLAALAALLALAGPAHAVFAVTEPWVRADANGKSDPGSTDRIRSS